MIVGYSRVSTRSQNIRLQVEEIERAFPECRAHFFDICSASVRVRHGLKGLLDSARAGLVSTIACYAVDRIGRDARALINLFDWLDDRGIRVVLLRQGIDTADRSPQTKLVLHTLISMAEFERGIISQRITSGLESAKMAGIRLGRPPTVTADPLEARRLRRDGLSFRAIAKELGLPLGTAFNLCKD